MAETVDQDGAVRMSKQEYEGLQRTLDILADDDAIAMLEASEEALEDGRTTTLADLKDELRD